MLEYSSKNTKEELSRDYVFGKWLSKWAHGCLFAAESFKFSMLLEIPFTILVELCWEAGMMLLSNQEQFSASVSPISFSSMVAFTCCIVWECGSQATGKLHTDSCLLSHCFQKWPSLSEMKQITLPTLYMFNVPLMPISCHAQAASCSR